MQLSRRSTLAGLLLFSSALTRPINAKSFLAELEYSRYSMYPNDHFQIDRNGVISAKQTLQPNKKYSLNISYKSDGVEHSRIINISTS